MTTRILAVIGVVALTTISNHILNVYTNQTDTGYPLIIGFVGGIWVAAITATNKK